MATWYSWLVASTRPQSMHLLHFWGTRAIWSDPPHRPVLLPFLQLHLLQVGLDAGGRFGLAHAEGIAQELGFSGPNLGTRRLIVTDGPDRQPMATEK